jgi:hypothetical protein
LKPILQVTFDPFGSDVRQGNLPENRPERFQGVEVHLMVAGTPKRRLRASLQKPVGPLVERELLAVQENRQAPLVSRIEAIAKEPLRPLPIRGSRRLAYHFSFLVLVADLPNL